MTTHSEQLKVSKVAQREMEVTQPGLLGRAKWAVMRKLLSTAGRTSKGVRTGYEYGFDSGTMLDYVYINRAEGNLLIGKLIDRVYLNAVGWRGIRARRVLLKQVLRAEVERNRAKGETTRLLDVAAGPGRYLQELLQECSPERGDLRILSRDLSAAGVAQGAEQARLNGLKAIQYEQGDAFNPAPTEAGLGGSPNVIVVSGLYELLLDDETLQKSLARLYQILAPGGAIYFTTQTRHPQLEFIANVLPNRDGLPWIMKCRPVAQLEAWARQAGFTQIESQLEGVGLFSVTSGRK
ncbi:MAG: class I SAM-dependent methyltransferase family protein [Chloroflexi bacterium]|nr:class I SAM-dependent methyltransferase family protein [Chloroflexota bacterium]